MSKNLGKLILCLKSLLKSVEFKTEIIIFLNRFFKHEYTEIRKNLARNFPGIISTLGSSSYKDNIKIGYESLCRDINNDVRRTTSLSFHEILNIVSPKITPLIPIFNEFLKDPLTQ